MSLVFPFDPDIARAATIPARLYTDPVYLALEQQRVFGRTWQVAGRIADLGETGAFITADIAGESVVVVRTADGLRAYHNVCPHRAGPVASGCGVRQTLQCKYHGWTFKLDGQLLRAPEMESTERFDPAEVRLWPVQVASWGPLVFVNLDLKAPPLAHFWDGVDPLLAEFRVHDMRHVLRKKYAVACNWKAYVDNYLEGYHLPMVHPTLNKELDYDQYRTEPFRYFSRQHAPLRAGTGPDRQYVAADGQQSRAEYLWCFPNIMLNVYLGQMQTNIVLPDGLDHTRVIFDWYASAPPADVTTDPAWSKLVAFSEEIQEEDREICEVVQKNLRSRIYDRGRYSAKREVGVHHFHGVLHEFLS
jgi:choline monooxygenase